MICSFISPLPLLLRVDRSVFWVWHLSSFALPKVLLHLVLRVGRVNGWERNVCLLLNWNPLSIAICPLLGSATYMPTADQPQCPLSDQAFSYCSFIRQEKFLWDFCKAIHTARCSEVSFWTWLCIFQFLTFLSPSRASHSLLMPDPYTA